MLLKCLLVIGFCLLYWLMCYMLTGGDKKNMLGFRSYPTAVQELVRQDERLGKLAPKKVDLKAVLVSNILAFTILFFVIGAVLHYAAGFRGFSDTFLYFLLFGQVLNAFDLVVIDLLWWRSTPRIRFSCVPDKAMYQDPEQHIDSFLRGIVMFAAAAALASLLLLLLP